VFAANGHAAVNATWDIYQRIVEAYRNPDRVAAK
jgi:transposase